MNENLIVVAHSIGNPMFIKYICKYNINIGLYISLAGFAQPFYVEGKDVLNQVLKPLSISDEEKIKNLNLINEKYSIYSDNDHIVPFKILEEYPSVVDSKPVFVSGIGHMGKKIGLEELPEVIKVIHESNYNKL
jgi:predicted alpha/beta hydrolase family esterase